MNEMPLTYQEQYILIHGYTDLIPVNWFYSDKYKSVEDVYRTAINNGVTWRELTKWNDDKSGSDL